MNIYLIGMPGSGKTTVARFLSKALSFEYVDLDGLIEKKAMMFIEEIFENYGETTFRKLEKEALSHLSGDQQVISCGGGIVLDSSNKDFMKGIIIYLDTDLDHIKKRLETEHVRPVLKSKSLETLYDERFIKYQQFADFIVSNDLEVSKTVDYIISILKEKQLL